MKKRSFLFLVLGILSALPALALDQDDESEAKANRQPAVIGQVKVPNHAISCVLADNRKRDTSPRSASQESRTRAGHINEAGI